MKRFKSFLAEQMEDFIEYRLQLGYSDRMLIYSLKILDQYVRKKDAGWASFDPLFFIRFRASLDHESRSINMVFRMLKMFFNFLVRRDHVQGNPLGEIAELKENQTIPFIFSPEETDLLLKALIKMIRTTGAYYLNDFSVYIAFLLMARCGLRVSETINLQKVNYRSEEKTIYIEKTKFKKDRLIPIPKDVCCEINNLINVRRVLIEKDNNPLLLVRRDKTGFSWIALHRRFKKALNHIHFNESRKVIGSTNFCGPTHHSLRHSFAVNTLKRIKQQGKFPQNALPVLAVYMGHSEYKYTTKYLRVLDAEHRRQIFDFSMLRSEDV
ncbi:MAG: tyrosine-type recombinase/integrase [Proteobacteria bacterium]|nr:tyrosine-type recombinase/integrase [Pseudomonadota bacterium]